MLTFGNLPGESDVVTVARLRLLYGGLDDLRDDTGTSRYEVVALLGCTPCRARIVYTAYGLGSLLVLCALAAAVAVGAHHLLTA